LRSQHVLRTRRLSRTLAARLGAAAAAGARGIELQKRNWRRGALAPLHLAEELRALLAAVEVGLGAGLVGDLRPVVADASTVAVGPR
jgi:hypothetical protein